MFVNGSPGDYRKFESQFEDFSKRFRIIARARDAFSRDDLENGLRFFFDGIRGSSGSFDRVSLVARTQLMAFARETQCELLTPEACLPNVRHIEIPDAGHSMHSANPAFYNNEVLAFLATY